MKNFIYSEKIISQKVHQHITLKINIFKMILIIYCKNNHQLRPSNIKF